MPANDSNSDGNGHKGTPERLARYELVDRLGSGQSALCYLARQYGADGFERLVALKKIRAHLARQTPFIETLQSELNKVAMLEHPRVIEIYEVGHEDRTHFIAQEYLAGQPLSSIIAAGETKQRPLNIYDAARIVADAADGLDAAHNLLAPDRTPLALFHRDIHPGNIMVLYDGGVKLVGFGFAKARRSMDSVAARLLKWTVGYAAPEQIDAGVVDHRADVFALGVVLWEALARRRLYSAEDRAASLELIRAQAPEPPSQFRPETPKELDAICLRALAVNPEERFQAARDIRIELENFLWTANYARESQSIAKYMASVFGEAIQKQQALVRHAITHRSRELEGNGGGGDEVLYVDPMAEEGHEEAANGRQQLPLPAPRQTGQVPVIPPFQGGGEAPRAAGKGHAPFDEDAVTDVKDVSDLLGGDDEEAPTAVHEGPLDPDEELLIIEEEEEDLDTAVRDEVEAIQDAAEETAVLGEPDLPELETEAPAAPAPPTAEPTPKPPASAEKAAGLAPPASKPLPSAAGEERSPALAKTQLGMKAPPPPKRPAQPPSGKTATAPVADKKAAPTADKKAAPKAAEKAAPTTDKKAAPAADKKAAPKAAEKAAPTADKKAAPVADKKAAPTADKKAAPVADKKAAPTADKKAAPTADKKAAPAADKKATPTADKKAAPKADKKAAPKADKKAAPTADKEAAPKADNKKAAPKAAEKAAPKAAEKAAPKAADKKAAPKAADKAAPKAADKAAPKADKKQAKTVFGVPPPTPATPKKKEAAVADKKATAPAADKKAAAPAADKKATAPAADKKAAAPAADKKAAPAPADKKAAAPAADKKAASDKEPAKAPAPPAPPTAAPLAATPQLLETTEERPSRRKAMWGIGAVVLLLVVVGVALGTRGKSGESASRSKPTEPDETAAGEQVVSAVSTPPDAQIEIPADAADEETRLAADVGDAAVPEDAEALAADELDAGAEVADLEADAAPPAVVAENPDRKPNRHRTLNRNRNRNRNNDREKERQRDREKARELYKQGVRQFVQGNTAAARRAFTVATKADPTYAPAFRGLGLAHERANNKKNAIKALKKYLSLSPDAQDAASIRKRIERLGG